MGGFEIIVGFCVHELCVCLHDMVWSFSATLETLIHGIPNMRIQDEIKDGVSEAIQHVSFFVMHENPMIRIRCMRTR